MDLTHVDYIIPYILYEHLNIYNINTLPHVRVDFIDIPNAFQLF